jgi:hypothetical protein
MIIILVVGDRNGHAHLECLRQDKQEGKKEDEVKKQEAGTQEKTRRKKKSKLKKIKANERSIYFNQ